MLVTGASGFFGAWLCKELLQQEALVFGLSKNNDAQLLKQHGIEKKIKPLVADITNPLEVERVFEQTKPEYCFHLAGIPSPSVCKEIPLEALQVNLGGSLNVLLSCAKNQTKVVAASTASVYGNQKKVDESSPLKAIEAYGFSKAKMEEIIRLLVQEKQLIAVVGRPSNLFGPKDSRENERFVPNNILRRLRGQAVQNNPTYVRDFLFVQDAVEAFLRMGEKAEEVSGMVFNVSSGQSFSGPELGEAIFAMIENRKPKIVLLLDYQVSNELIQKKLGWKPRYSLEEGLRETIEWYKKVGGTENESRF